MSQHTFHKKNGAFERKLDLSGLQGDISSQLNMDVIRQMQAQVSQQQPPQGGQIPQTPFQPNNQTIPDNTQQPPQTPQVPNYAETFNSVMLDILEKARGVDTVELLKRKRALERASLDRASEITPEELRTLSPSQQAAIRGADVKALQPDIDENAFKLAKAEQQIDNFYKSFNAVSKLGADFADKLPLPEKVKESFIEALQQRPTSDWGSILAGLNDKQKTEVLGEVDYSNIAQDVVGIPEGKPSIGVEGAVFVSPDGDEIDVSTVNGIKALADKDFSYGEILAFLDENTKLTTTSIKNLLKDAGLKPTEEDGEQFLNEEFFSGLFTDEQLKEAAKEAGFTEGGFLGIGVGKEGVNNFLKDLMSKVEQFRKAGFTDKEILKKMQ